MKVTLRIQRVNFDLIKKGVKKNEFRDPSIYNKRLLLKKQADGKYAEYNPDIKEVEFIAGRGGDRLRCKVLQVRAVKFSRNIDSEEDNLHAIEGACAIHIKLGAIIK